MDDSWTLGIAVALMATALGLFFLEILIPSGGVLGIGAAVAAIAGIIMLFQFDTTLGLIGATVSLAGLPVLFGLAIKLWPSTPVARLLSLRAVAGRSDRNDDGDDGEDDDRTEDPPAPNRPAVGETGQTLTALRPVGACRINGKRLDCIADGGVIAPGTKVRVVAVDGFQVKVRPTDR